jgi:hypothetical protein
MRVPRGLAPGRQQPSGTDLGTSPSRNSTTTEPKTAFFSSNSSTSFGDWSATISCLSSGRSSELYFEPLSSSLFRIFPNVIGEVQTPVWVDADPAAPASLDCQEADVWLCNQRSSRDKAAVATANEASPPPLRSPRARPPSPALRAMPLAVQRSRADLAVERRPLQTQVRRAIPNSRRD